MLGVGTILVMSESPESSETEAAQSTGATIHMEVDGAPTFDAPAKLETWDTPDGSVTGFRYSEDAKIMERADHVAKVREVMDRDAASQ